MPRVNGYSPGLPSAASGVVRPVERLDRRTRARLVLGQPSCRLPFASLQKARLLRDRDLLPLDAQRGRVDHLVLVDDRAEPLIDVGLLVELEDSVARVSSSFDGVNTSLMILIWSGWIAHLPSKPICEAARRLCGTGRDRGTAASRCRSRRCRRRAPRRSSSSSGSGRPGTALGQLLGADVAGVVGDAEDEPGHARRAGRDLVRLDAPPRRSR